MNAVLSRTVAALSVAAGAAVLFAPQPPAVAGGLLLGFVLPGMALLEVVFRGRALTAVERIVLTPALSMGVLIVAGLLIHVAGLRIDRLAWTVATVGVTLAGVVAARLLPGAARTGRRTAPRGRARRRRFLPLVLVLAVLAGASWLSLDTSRSAGDIAVTALSATPSGPVDAAGNRTVRVSASGLPAGEAPYTIRVTGPFTAIRRTVATTRDGTWTEVLSLPAAQRMTVSLYRSGDTTAYRTLYLSAVD